MATSGKSFGATDEIKEAKVEINPILSHRFVPILDEHVLSRLDAFKISGITPCSIALNETTPWAPHRYSVSLKSGEMKSLPGLLPRETNKFDDSLKTIGLSGERFAHVFDDQVRIVCGKTDALLCAIPIASDVLHATLDRVKSSVDGKYLLVILNQRKENNLVNHLIVIDLDSYRSLRIFSDKHKRISDASIINSSQLAVVSIIDKSKGLIIYDFDMIAQTACPHAETYLPDRQVGYVYAGWSHNYWVLNLDLSQVWVVQAEMKAGRYELTPRQQILTGLFSEYPYVLCNSLIFLDRGYGQPRVKPFVRPDPGDGLLCIDTEAEERTKWREFNFATMTSSALKIEGFKIEKVLTVMPGYQIGLSGRIPRADRNELAFAVCDLASVQTYREQHVQTALVAATPGPALPNVLAKIISADYGRFFSLSAKEAAPAIAAPVMKRPI